MSQVKVYEFAKEIGMETLALMDKIREWNLPVRSHMASLDSDLQAKIKTNLESESSSKKTATKKKAAKKKAATKAKAKKTATKKATAKKSTAKKAVTKKKTVVKKAVTRKVATAEAAAEEAEAPAAPQKRVIRRQKAFAPETLKAQAEAELKAKDEAEEAARQAALAESIKAAQANEEAVQAPEAVVEPQADEMTTEAAARVGEEVSTVGEEPVSAEPPKAGRVEVTADAKGTVAKPRRNIVGKMDLTKVRGTAKPSSSTSTPTRKAPEGSVKSGPRNLRTGFVAPPPPMPAKGPELPKKKEAFAKKKGAGAGVKEAPVSNFISADYRKREVIFQPKKKKANVVAGKSTQVTTPAAHKRVVEVAGPMEVREVAHQLGIKVPVLTRHLMGMGEMVKMTDMLDLDTISLIAPEFGYDVKKTVLSEDEMVSKIIFGNIEKGPVPRPPVVTVMGHVDHGKTTLLDSIRKANVVKGEAGGITQHIGAYKVSLGKGKVVTFLDTPGHAAFTEMRARGAQVTDIVIVVVAADDGMMPQTVEAISHAKASGVPVIVAVNKMDRPNANPDKIKQQLSEHELVPEDWGGSTIFCPVSALKGEGIEALLEQILLVAEMEELTANPDRSAEGVVIESQVEKGRGNVATILVNQGTLKKGDYFAVGTTTGRVRGLMNDQGKNVKEAIPGDPVSVTGLNEVPSAGDRFHVCKTEKEAQDLANLRVAIEDAAGETPHAKMSLEDLFKNVKTGVKTELPVVLKSDVAGSSEAVKGMLSEVGNEEVSVKLVHDAVGGISESDVLLCSASGGVIIGFNVRPDVKAVSLAKERGVEIKCYTIIYELIDNIKKALSGLLKPDIVETPLGSAEVRETFSVPKVGLIAGCNVQSGKIARSNLLRLVRDGRVIYEGKVSSLKRFKDDVKEVSAGYECGIGIENFNDLKAGDVIEAFEMKEIARSLD